MDKFISHLNYKIASSKDGAKKVGFIIVNNPDGTPRWICNSKSNKPLFLKFYLVSSFKSKLFAIFFKLVFKLRLQKRILNYKEFYIEKLSDTSDCLLDVSLSNWALFTGTVGPNNKMLIFQETNQGNHFYKVGTTDTSKLIIDNEKKTLTKLENLFASSFLIPKIIASSDKYIKLEDLSFLENRKDSLSSLHINFIKNLNKIDNKHLTKKNFVDLFDLESRLNHLKVLNDKRIPKGILRKLDFLLNKIDSDKIRGGLGHGDFTPWNMYVNNDQLGVYDWELSKSFFPLGFDAFHFVFQQNIMVSRVEWKYFKIAFFEDELIKDLFNEVDNGKSTIETIQEYLKYYLLINIIEYLDVYSRQENWHVQIYWLLETWNDALSNVLENDFLTQRGLFINDFFDFLNNKNYATIKFTKEEPEKLSVYSDIDLCIQKKDSNDVLAYVQKAQFVKSISIVSKSYMTSILINFENSEVLALDFICKFKRKSLVFLDEIKVLTSAEINNFGVKSMNNIELSHYVGLFYGLNNAFVPDHYLYLNEFLDKSKKLDVALLKSYKKEDNKNISLPLILKEDNQNKGTKKIINKFIYLIDIIRGIKVSKGLIITFSGVDGAGKSTIIENVKKELEKKYRKQVVVIRHRPSLLPILSAWTKGKAQAEKDAASTLPRQGKNGSLLSSLIRFSYYYLDYIIGQLYVNFKYKYRGVIVLYDRYYYDFILDSKRSNITLPEGLVGYGFNFVFTPNCNFFLYASPEIILKRKQELSAETILELTGKYSNLFNTLEDKRGKNNYFLINNIDLDTTMSKIMETIVSKF